MSERTEINVIIGGKIISISGYEDEEYMQRLASYVSNKVSEVANLEGYLRLDSDKKNVLLALNIADDFFKLRDDYSAFVINAEENDKEKFTMKHELLAERLKIENLTSEIEKLREKNNELEKKIVRLETELNNTAKYVKKSNRYEKIKHNINFDTEKDKSQNKIENKNLESDNIQE